jgi:hypothetical protein
MRMAGSFQQRHLAERLAAAGKATGELLWRLPLADAYDKQINSDAADMKNVGGRNGGSITAAQFLQRFIKDTPWAHLDIAGMAWSDRMRDVPEGPRPSACVCSSAWWPTTTRSGERDPLLSPAAHAAGSGAAEDAGARARARRSRRGHAGPRAGRSAGGHLWTYNDRGFCRMGRRRTASPPSSRSGSRSRTRIQRRPGAALADGAESERIADFRLCVELFDGGDEQAVAAPAAGGL